MHRLTQLLDLDEEETESYISSLVTAKTVYAKIDRPARVVTFAKTRDADEVLNEWSKCSLGEPITSQHVLFRASRTCFLAQS